MKKTLLGGHIFNLRLYLEGLKRLRVISMVIGIITVVFSALIPIVAWMEAMRNLNISTIGVIDFQSICVPAALAVMAAPLFIMILFSFLQKRQESDFFHAIPYTRTCVYVSFVASALTSIFAIQLTAGLVAGILWSFVPFTTFDVGSYICVILADLLAAAMLASFMAIARTVSGTGGSCFLLFGLFASITRIVLGLFIALLVENFVLDVSYWTDASFLSPMWFYPIAAVGAPLSSSDVLSHFLFNPATIIYSVIVTILLFAFAGWLYYRRQSEMAGNPAPSKKLQAFFRILFTLPMALLTTTLILTTNIDASLLLTLVTLTLLCYFLYELITTKRAKNMLTAIPALGIVLGACILFGSSQIGIDVYMQNEVVKPDDIVEVTFPEQYASTSENYYGYYEDITVDDREIIEIFSASYDKTKAYDTFYLAQQMNVSFTLKNGTKLYRCIRVDSKDLSAIAQRFAEAGLQYQYYRVPAPADVGHVTLAISFGERKDHGYRLSDNGQEAADLIKLLEEEFNTLSVEDKKSVFVQDGQYKKGYNGFVLLLSRSNYGLTKCYHINEKLPRTRLYLQQIFDQNNLNEIEKYPAAPYLNPMTAAEILDYSLDLCKRSESALAVENTNIYFCASPVDTTDFRALGDGYNLSGEELNQLILFLRERAVTSEKELAAPSGSDEHWFIYFRYAVKDERERIECEVYTTIALGDGDLSQLKKLLKTYE